MKVSLKGVHKALQTNFSHLAAGAGNLVHKTAVVALYTLIGGLHLAQAPLSMATGNIKRAKLNWTACKVAMYALYSFTLPKSSPYHSRFDFHHLSYGLAFMLLPGRPTRFGKWMSFDSLVNYNHLGVFYGTRGSHFFVRNAQNKIEFKEFENEHISKDGSLAKLGSIYFEDKGQTLREEAFPADTVFVRRYKILLKEMFYLRRATPLLDALSEAKDRVAIDEAALPFLKQLKKRPKQLQLKLDIDLSLFKG